MKKTVFGLVCLLLAAGIVFGGGGQQGGAGGQPTATSNFNFTGYPMNRMNDRITWSTNQDLANRVGSIQESPFHNNYSTMVGVTIDWSRPTVGTTYDQLYTQLMAGAVRDLPYIMSTTSQTAPELLIEEGVMWDLTPYIERWSPNYVREMNRRPERLRAMRTDSGKFWSYGFFREDGPFMDTWVGPIIRRDWLNANNLPIPRTIDDWDRTLQVFKDRYGAMWTGERGFFFDHPGLAGAFGAYTGYNYGVFVRNGRVEAANVQREWLDYIAKMNEWYTRGLIDPDHLTLDRTTFNSKALEGQVGITYAAGSRVQELVLNATAARNGADWIGIEYPRGPNNTLVAVQGGWGIVGSGGGSSAWITRAVPPESLELVMRVLDYAYSEEGFMFTNFGMRGDTWNYDSSGNFFFTDKWLNDIDAPDYEQTRMRYVGQRGGYAGIQATAALYLPGRPEDSPQFSAFTAWYQPNQEQAYSWRMPPGITLTVEEALRNAELISTINTYVAETAANFVTGQTPLSQFNAFVARLNQIGLQEALAIQQAAHDRWQRR